ncbi:GtrA family protein [Corynebacterium suicordis]|uniref:GtrA family protein n=1 Tax=Corynebacterium suicordis DSM 45110 TaxID=1121369 RepID=A0ABR9ZGS3_9CORY|nr:GtrA family protein [Corynebacterium suicordis DSM 45110]MDR6278423.1 putative flippase GtrA [Corynebacterium suicordis]
MTEHTTNQTNPSRASAAATPRSSTMQRGRRVARQFLRFGIVGASGFIVNQAVFVVAKKLSSTGFELSPYDVFLNLMGTQFNMRWHHVFSILAFLVANVWNFVLNRYWTFGGAEKQKWWKQLPQFMAVGVFGLLITLAVSTALVNPESPIALPQDIFDDSTGMRTKAYWGNFIGVLFAVPANFLFNKLWTFRVVREKHANTGNSDAVDAVEAVVTGK